MAATNLKHHSKKTKMKMSISRKNFFKTEEGIRLKKKIGIWTSKSWEQDKESRCKKLRGPRPNMSIIMKKICSEPKVRKTHSNIMKRVWRNRTEEEKEVIWNKIGGSLKQSYKEGKLISPLLNPKTQQKAHNRMAKTKRRQVKDGIFKSNWSKPKVIEKCWGTRKLRYGRLGLKNPTKTKRKKSIARKEFIRKNPQKAHEISLKGAKNARKKLGLCGTYYQTSIEKKTEQIIQELNLPYKYTGLGEIWIENMNPDFFNVNGQKKVIEVLGSYWHNKRETQKRIERYKQYGYTMLPLWDYELKDYDNVKQKLIQFDKL